MNTDKPIDTSSFRAKIAGLAHALLDVNEVSAILDGYDRARLALAESVTKTGPMMDRISQLENDVSALTAENATLKERIGAAASTVSDVVTVAGDAVDEARTVAPVAHDIGSKLDTLIGHGEKIGKFLDRADSILTAASEIIPTLRPAAAALTAADAIANSAATSGFLSKVFALVNHHHSRIASGE